MSDYISRADAIEAVAEEWLSEASAESPYVNDNDIDRYRELAEELFSDIPSAEQVASKLKKPCDSLLTDDSAECKEQKSKLESADAVHIHKDGTLNVKVPNAQKVGRVLIMDTDSHIGGGLFYPADAVHGEWKQEYRKTANGVDFCVIACSECDYYDAQMHYYNYCPSCGARMENTK